uniref:Cathepsin propeptide inhibitor domain-containing protein n=1 Tax=Ananas comosus var. bracteatus TaxID=296719 RepID=A0A6V7P4S8_ANACO|nr:unnamed protein product [Ananas comosus var. bracteatus]
MGCSSRLGGSSLLLVSLALSLMVAVAAAAGGMSILGYGARSEAEVRRLYRSWMGRHGKWYNGVGEEERRFEIFKENLRYVDEHNAAADARPPLLPPRPQPLRRSHQRRVPLHSPRRPPPPRRRRQERERSGSGSDRYRLRPATLSPTPSTGGRRAPSSPSRIRAAAGVAGHSRRWRRWKGSTRS